MSDPAFVLILAALLIGICYAGDETMTFRFRPWVWYSCAINHRQTLRKDQIQMFTHPMSALTRAREDQEGEVVMHWIALAVIALALNSTRKPKIR